MSNIRITLLTVMAFFVSTSVMAQCAYFYADQQVNGRALNTDVFSVELSGTDALLQHVVSVNGLYQIAYNADNENIYLFNINGSSFMSYNVTSGTFGPNIQISPSFNRISHVEANADGSLSVTQDPNGYAFQVDPITGIVSKSNYTGGRVVGANQLNRTVTPRSTSLNTSIGGLTTYSQANNTPTTGKNIGAPTDGAELLTFIDNTFEFILVDGVTGQPIGQSFDASFNGDPFFLDTDGCLTGSCLAANVPGPPPPPGPAACEYDYYLARNDLGSEIYGVELVGTDANLTLLETRNYPVHIALDGDNNILYLVSNTSSNPVTVQSYDPETGDFGPIVSLAIPHVTQAVFGNGELYVGSVDDNTIYTVDYNTGIITPVASVNVSGGDLIFDENGDLLSVSNRTVTKVSLTGGSNSTFANLGSGNYAVGMGLLSTGNIIVASYQNDALMELDNAGNIVGSFDLKLNGNTFVQNNGDIASACVAVPTPPTPDCDFAYYLSRNVGSGRSATSELYGVELNGADAELTLLENFSYPIHIAMDGDNELLYLVSNYGAATVQSYEPATGTFGPLVNLTLTDVPQVAFGNGTLYVASSNDDVVYTVDYPSGTTTAVGSVNVSGGDLVFDENGDLLSVSARSITKVSLTGGSNTTYANLGSGNPVVGLGLTDNGSLLASTKTDDELTEFDNSGSVLATYSLKLNGASFTQANGDLASACVASTPPPSVPTCEFAYYLSRNLSVGGSMVSELYGVELNGANAELTLLEDFNYAIHIATDEDGLVYIVGNGTLATVQTYDPATGTFGTLVTLPIGNLPQAVYGNGTLYVASGNDNTVYSVDYPAGTVTAVGSAIAGTGDLVFTEAGDLWSVSTSNDLSIVDISGGSNTSLGNISGASVVGFALTDGGNVLVSQNGSSQLSVLDASGAATGDTYTLKLNGATFTQQKGDLASACVATPPTTPTCDQVYFLSRNTNSGAEVYGVEVNGTDAELTLLTTFNTPVHLAFNSNTSDLYAVTNSNPATIYTYNTLTATTGAPVSVTGIDGVVQMTYDDVNDLLYIGSQTDNAIYTVDPTTGASTFVANADVDGGDLVLTSSGALLNSSNGSNEIATIAGGSSTPLASFSGTLVGLASTPDSTILAAFSGSDELVELDENGVATGNTLSLVLNGASFTEGSGDLAGGCGAFVAPTNKKGAEEASTAIAPESIAAISVYPNPANDRVTVEFTAASEINEVEVAIFNTMGQMVSSTDFVGSVKTTIDLSDLRTGMYLVIVKESGAAAHTTKLIVE